MHYALFVDIQRETPSFTEFRPVIPWQYRLLYDLDHVLPFTNGTQEILCSGTMGSAKSLLAAHIVLKHVTKHPRSRFLIGRVVLGDLKDTALDTILDHMEGDFVEGVHYEHNRSLNKLTFQNGSEIITRAWHNKKFKKFRSLKLSGAWIEEASENDDKFFPAITEIYNRVGRLPHVPENLMLYTTNPDSPSHKLYQRMIATKNPNRHVYYSDARDNPFLPEWYIPNLLESLDPKMAQRLVYGKWVEVTQEQIYWNYSTEQNYIDKKYKFDFSKPIDIMFDFNIASGKPMSAAVGQYRPDGPGPSKFHVAKTYIVEGARTQDILDEMESDGLFEFNARFRIFGDGTGDRRDTRSKHSDYDIIKKFLSNYYTKDDHMLEFEMKVPRSNPPIRTRHNIMNSVFKNAKGQVLFHVYQSAKDADEGLRLTKLKDGAQYIEDDSYRLQHVTTAIGYWVVQVLKDSGRIETIYKKMV